MLLDVCSAGVQRVWQLDDGEAGRRHRDQAGDPCSGKLENNYDQRIPDHAVQ